MDTNITGEINVNGYLIGYSNAPIKQGDLRVNIEKGYIVQTDEDDVWYCNQRKDVFKKVISRVKI